MPELKRKQTFQSIAWFRDLKNRRLLNLDPPYQRWSVWPQDFRQKFIETILLAYPSPAVFLFRKVDEEGVTIYDVVDGKQRLMAIFDFIDGKFALSDNSPIAAFQGKSFSSFTKDEKVAFYDYDLGVEYLPTNNETVIDDIFERLNRNVARLTAQELRHAKFSGDFIKAAESLATWTWGIPGEEEPETDADADTDSLPRLPSVLPRMQPQARRQMKDVEVVATLLLFLEEGIKSYTARDLDQAFSNRESWDDADEIIEEYRRVIDEIRSLITHEEGTFIIASRIRNQADFYSFFAAIAELRRERKTPLSDKCLTRLREFLETVETETTANTPAIVREYYDAVRSASNDPGPRSTRIRIVKEVLLGVPHIAVPPESTE